MHKVITKNCNLSCNYYLQEEEDKMITRFCKWGKAKRKRGFKYLRTYIGKIKPCTLKKR